MIHVVVFVGFFQPGPNNLCADVCRGQGVDQYNACYGGQACGLCTLSWVESDRPLVEHAAIGWVGVARKFGEDIDVCIYLCTDTV